LKIDNFSISKIKATLKFFSKQILKNSSSFDFMKQRTYFFGNLKKKSGVVNFNDLNSGFLSKLQVFHSNQDLELTDGLVDQYHLGGIRDFYDL